MKYNNLARRLLLIIYVVLWCGGVVTYSTGVIQPENFKVASPLFLLTAGILVTLFAKNDLKKIAIVFSLGFLVEVVGVATGVPFGVYAYTPVLGAKLFEVPIVLGFSWVILIFYVQNILSVITTRSNFLAGKYRFWYLIIIGALMMVAIDLLIDPLAAGPLNYWKWQSDGAYFHIPLSNFIGWFLVSVILLYCIKIPTKVNIMSIIIGQSVIIFFSIIALALDYVVLGGIGVVTSCIIGYALKRALKFGGTYKDLLLLTNRPNKE